jgi:hypothetical protein
MPTKYSDVVMYLDAIANNANGDVASAPHGYWWHVNQDINQAPLAYNDFVTGTVFGVTGSSGNPIPIIGTDSKQTDPLQSEFYILLSTPNGSGGFPQMPKGGPFITDAGFSVTLSDNATVTGAQIMTNLEEWLGHGYPE